MRRLLVALALTALMASSALADKPNLDPIGDYERVSCDLVGVCWTWDGTFTTETCDATGGAPVWQYGPSSGIPTVDCYGEPITAVLGTILNGNYPSNAGQRAILGGSFLVSESCHLLELCHYYDTENSYDGGNLEVKVGSTYTVVPPIGGYPDSQLCESTSFYAYCVDMQPGFTDGPTAGFVKDCFDLSAFMGQTVQIAVKFGSDSSVVYPGWYIAGVMAGGLVTAIEDSNWSTIKQLY
ncbi:hypothetical protein FJ251_12260 [bacterium]|nr:hypothetical protein [bacterium]